MRTANPALNQKTFEAVIDRANHDVMTLEGTVNKCLIAILVTMAAGCWTFCNPAIGERLFFPAMIISLVVSLVVIFVKKTAPYLTLIYALVEGVMLGTISIMIELSHPGIAFQAVTLTFGTLFSLLIVYKSGLVRVTENFKLGILAATGAIFILYLINFIMSLFGAPLVFLHSSSPLSIGISCVVVVIAALNLVLDFDFIEQAAGSGSYPRYMEWYGAFGLLVTLVWLYIEILRLLAKLNSRD
jgi:uncharacterized YccA/Bax inhibitor family protein